MYYVQSEVYVEELGIQLLFTLFRDINIMLASFTLDLQLEL